MKPKKSFFDFEKNDENKNFDDDESNANKNNLSADMNEKENQIDSAKNSQKKENAITKIVDEKSKKSESKNDWEIFFDF